MRREDNRMTKIGAWPHRVRVAARRPAASSCSIGFV